MSHKNSDTIFTARKGSKKMQALIEKMMNQKIEEYTEAEKKTLYDLQTKATQCYFQVTGENYLDSYVWYAMAKNLQCKISYEKNKWGRMRFELNGCDPGNDSYNGKVYYKKVIATRRYLLKEFQKKYKCRE